MLSLKEIYNRLSSELLQHQKEDKQGAEEKKVKQLQEEIDRLEAQIKGDVEAIDKLTQERDELYRNLDYTERKIEDSTAHLDNLKYNSRVLEDDNKCLKDDINNLVSRDEGKNFKYSYT